jgi:hypothetical protein
MAKRTSFEEKSKGMHASRKLIIDTVFGREDTTQRVHGYEIEAEKKREVGEVWTDKEGKEWEQKDGFKINTTKFDEVRQFLQKITNCSAEECETIQYSTADKKLIAKTGLCANCLVKEEAQLRADGTYPFYEDYKMSLNKLAYIRDVKDEYEEALKGVSQQIQILNEDGTTQNWQWDIDIDKVKADIQSDIDGAYDAIEALLERKLALEEKLRELNHPELIKN